MAIICARSALCSLLRILSVGNTLGFCVAGQLKTRSAAISKHRRTTRNLTLTLPGYRPVMSSFQILIRRLLVRVSLTDEEVMSISMFTAGFEVSSDDYRWGSGYTNMAHDTDPKIVPSQREFLASPEVLSTLRPASPVASDFDELWLETGSPPTRFALPEPLSPPPTQSHVPLATSSPQICSRPLITHGFSIASLALSKGSSPPPPSAVSHLVPAKPINPLKFIATTSASFKSGSSKCAYPPIRPFARSPFCLPGHPFTQSQKAHLTKFHSEPYYREPKLAAPLRPRVQPTAIVAPLHYRPATFIAPSQPKSLTAIQRRAASAASTTPPAPKTPGFKTVWAYEWSPDGGYKCPVLDCMVTFESVDAVSWHASSGHRGGGLGVYTKYKKIGRRWQCPFENCKWSTTKYRDGTRGITGHVKNHDEGTWCPMCFVTTPPTRKHYCHYQSAVKAGRIMGPETAPESPASS